jgi:hypothetical protein
VPDKPVYKFTPTTAKPTEPRDQRRDDHSYARRDTPPAGRFDNANQDPDHPMNRTLPKDVRPGAERDRIEGPVYASDNLMTEQEKDATGDSLGVGPLAQSEHASGPVETVEQLGIGPRTPYPEGDPPSPAESITYSQGIKGVTDKAQAKPGSSSGAAGRAPGVADKAAAYRADRSKDPAGSSYREQVR